MINRRQFGWALQGQLQHFLPHAAGRRGTRDFETDRARRREETLNNTIPNWWCFVFFFPLHQTVAAQVPCIPLLCNSGTFFFGTNMLWNFYHLTNIVSLTLDSNVQNAVAVIEHEGKKTTRSKPQGMSFWECLQQALFMFPNKLRVQRSHPHGCVQKDLFITEVYRQDLSNYSKRLFSVSARLAGDIYSTPSWENILI